MTGTLGGRFDLSWTGGGTNSTRLSNWLDPTNKGLQTTNTTNISNLAAPGPFVITYNISGISNPCPNSINTYQITNPPISGTLVNWTISPNDGSLTITPSANGFSCDVDMTNAILGQNYNLTASTPTLNTCQTISGLAQFQIPSTVFQGQVYGLSGWNTNYGAALVEGDNYFYTGSGANYFEVFIADNNGGTIQGGYWSHESGDYASGGVSSYYLAFDGYYNNYIDSYYDYHFSDNCGSHTLHFHFITNYGYPPSNRVQSNNNPKYSLKLTPNPASDFVQVSVEYLTLVKSKQTQLRIGKQFDYNTPKQISIYNKLGVLVLQRKITIPKTGLKLNIAELSHNEVYNISIDDGNGNRLVGRFIKL